MRLSKLIPILFVLLLPASAVRAAGDPVLIGLDAEFGHKSSTSAQAIERGILVALDEINERGGVLGGRPLSLVTRDNRSVPARARANIRNLASMKDLVAVVTGKFSPVALELIPLVHELKLPFLDPWAAADGIIDNGHEPNYAFRVSLRDSWAIPKMVRHAQARGFNRFGMMAPKNGWGRSNVKAMQQMLSQEDGKTVVLTGIQWHFWGDQTLIGQYLKLVKAGADAIILIANESEAAILLKEIASIPEADRRPIFSHWGITGGDLRKLVGGALDIVDLSVIQTFTFSRNTGRKALEVSERAKAKFGLADASEIRSQVGFAHGYDIAHILAMAVDRAGSTEREQVRNALERLGRYEGLVRTYDPPFTAQRHEALSPDVLFMGRFSNAGDLRRID